MNEKDLVLHGHLNGDVGNLCGLPNFGNKSCVSCACLPQFTFLFLAQVGSCSKFDLTLGVIPSE